MKKLWPSSERIIKLFTQKFVTKNMGLGSGINLFRVQGQKGTGFRIRNTDLYSPQGPLISGSN